MGNNNNFNAGQRLTSEELRDMMFTDVWTTLSDEKKINVLQQISDNHLKELGIPESHRPPLQFEDMDPGVYGSYDRNKNKIVLSKELLQDDKMFKVIETLHHEGFHAYQQNLIKHPEDYSANKESAETIERWTLNLKPGAYILNQGLYESLYASQGLEHRAYLHGLQEMQTFFESKSMIDTERYSYEVQKKKCDENFQKLDSEAQAKLGSDYLRKTDIVVNYRGINAQANELANEMDNAKNIAPQMTKEITEIKTALNNEACDLLPILLKGMTEQQLQDKEKELSDLQHRLDNLQKQYEKSLHATKTISMGYEEHSVDIASLAQTSVPDSKAQTRAQQGGQQQVAQQTVQLEQPDKGLARC